MLNWDRVWARLAKLPEFRTKKQEHFRSMEIGKQFQLTSLAVVGPTPISFPGGAVVMGLGAGLSVNNQAGTTSIRDISSVRVSIDYPTSEGAVVTGGRMNLAALLGKNGDRQWPYKELLVPVNGAFNVTVENLTTSTLDLDLVFHCMIYRAANV